MKMKHINRGNLTLFYVLLISLTINFVCRFYLYEHYKQYIPDKENFFFSLYPDRYLEIANSVIA